MIVIAGKNNIAVHALESTRRMFPARELAIVCNKSEAGSDGWQRSLRALAQQLDVREISLDDAYRQATTFLSLEFDRIVKPERFASERTFNIHFSKLPRYKGMYTSVWPILFGDAESAVTLHRIDAGIDTGDVVAQTSFSIPQHWVSRDLYFGYTAAACALFDAWVERLVSGKVSATPQAAAESTYYGKNAIDFRAIALQPAATAWQYQRQVHAFAFREYQFQSHAQHRVVGALSLPQKSTRKAGTLLNVSDDHMDVATIDYDTRLFFDRLDALFDACRSNDLARVKRLIHNIAGRNDCNERGWTPLIVACYAGAYEVVQYLLEQGADVHRPNHRGTTPLMYAKDAFLAGRCRRTFDLLRSRGANSAQSDYSGRRIVDYVTSAEAASLGIA
jgi:methionyl-tRNA formyltransferase